MHQNLIQPPMDRGVVILSTEAAYKNWVNPTTVGLLDERKKERGTRIIFDSLVLPSDFDGQHGNVRSMMLEGGTYYIVPQALVNYCIGARPQYKFTVVPGELTYIGSFRLVGNGLVYSPEAKRDRDIEFFRQRNPALAGTEIKSQAVEISRDSVGQCGR
jgi:hypothetical protein